MTEPTWQPLAPPHREVAMRLEDKPVGIEHTVQVSYNTMAKQVWVQVWNFQPVGYLCWTYIFISGPNFTSVKLCPTLPMLLSKFISQSYSFPSQFFFPFCICEGDKGIHYLRKGGTYGRGSECSGGVWLCLVMSLDKQFSFMLFPTALLPAVCTTEPSERASTTFPASHHHQCF